MTASFEEKPIKIYVREAFLIPIKYLTAEQIQKAHDRFTLRFYNDRACQKCEYFEDRHSEVCDSCAAFTGVRQMSKIVVPAGAKAPALSLPAGAKKKLKNYLVSIGRFEGAKLVSRRPEAKTFSRPIKFLGVLKDFQVEAKDAILDRKYGLISSPPRSGKTVIFCATVCERGNKTLILGSQTEWLSQFRETFLGSDTVKAFTNARPEQVKICKTLKDFQDTDVCLATFSRFMSTKGKALLRQIASLFDTVCVDEVQTTPALQTARVLAKFNSNLRIGLSGTIERKVTEEIEVTKQLFGPIIYKSVVERLRPTVHVFYPAGGVKEPTGFSQAAFTGFQTRLEVNSGRKESILRCAIKYAEMGHMVLIPMSRVDPILEWVRWTNELMGPKYAMPFYGGIKKPDRMPIIEMARRYECKMLIGNITQLSVGMNIPRASCLFEIGINSNVPKAEQRMSRILTPFDGKPDPVIVLCLDDYELIRKCKRNEFYNCLVPRFDPIIKPAAMQQIKTYFSSPKYRQPAFNRNDI